MKTSFLYFMLCASMLFGTTVLTSCGDDEEDDGDDIITTPFMGGNNSGNNNGDTDNGGSNTNLPSLEPASVVNGVRVASFQLSETDPVTKLGYDSRGRLISFNDFKCISYSPLRYVATDGTEIRDIETNESGYLTAYTVVYTSNDEMEDKAVYYLSYTDDGYIGYTRTERTKVNKDNGDTDYSESDVSLDWSYDRLRSIEYSYDSNGKEISNLITFDYTEGVTNKYAWMMPDCCGWGYYAFYFAGLCGKGPSKLPSKMTWEQNWHDWTNGRGGSSTWEYTYAYTTAQDGSIATCTKKHADGSITAKYTFTSCTPTK